MAVSKEFAEREPFLAEQIENSLARSTEFVLDCNGQVSTSMVEEICREARAAGATSVLLKNIGPECTSRFV